MMFWSVKKISILNGLRYDGIFVLLWQLFFEVVYIDSFLESPVLMMMELLIFKIFQEFELLFGHFTCMLLIFNIIARTCNYVGC